MKVTESSRWRHQIGGVALKMKHGESRTTLGGDVVIAAGRSSRKLLS
jgi:hypothetical protein